MQAKKFHPRVSSDIKSAYKWYQGQARGLGDDLLDELESAYQAIAERPEAWSFFQKGFRRYLLSRFPFSVIYRESGDEIIVIAIMHNSRKPAYWYSRV